MKVRAEGSADDGYLASVSDLMVGLLFIFIILLMAYALNFRKAETYADQTIRTLAEERDEIARERDELQEIQAGLRARQDELLKRQEQLEESRNRLEAIADNYSTRNAVRRAMLEEIQSLLGDWNVPVTIVPENGVLRLPEEMLFESARAALRPEAEPALRALAEVLARILPCHALNELAIGPDCDGAGAGLIETVLIEGHTDDLPMTGGRFDDNWDLGARRGTSVFERLTELQPRLDALTNNKGEALLGVSSYEARRPVRAEDSDAARRLNRRIDIRFLISAPGDEELRAISRAVE